MHAIYTTPGFIIGSRSYGEASKLISIFTRDFGLVTASAQGIRLEKSKLRYQAQDYSFGIFSLVRGREMWRLTSASEDSESTKTIAPLAQKELIARLALILKRLLHGEEANVELFICVEAIIDFINNNSDSLNDDHLKTLESIAIIRIMQRLGYIGDTSDLNGHVSADDLSIEMTDNLKDKRFIMNQHINKALKASHL